MSSIVFFPLFPLLASAVHGVLGVSVEWSLVLVSNVCLGGCFLVMSEYIRGRQHSPHFVNSALLAFGLFPTAFFLRVAYSESTFMLLAVLTMLALQKRWSNWAVAFVIGLCTASRPVGITLLIPFMMHLWASKASVAQRLATMAVLCPLACWGLIAFMSYQWLTFDDPLAFIRAHAAWTQQKFEGSLLEQAVAFVSLDPVWDVYYAYSPCCWQHHPPEVALLNLSFVNPIVFLITLFSLLIGRCCRILDADECLLGLAILVIPYLSHGHRCCMLGMARYALVAFPVYLVYGAALSKLPFCVAAALLFCSGSLMCIYASLWSAWYFFI